MKLDLTNEERDQLAQLTLNHIGVLKTLIEDAEKDQNENDFNKAVYKGTFNRAKAIHRKLTAK